MQIPSSSQASIAIVGVPFDAHSSYLPGAAKAPAAIRKALKSKCHVENKQYRYRRSFWMGWQSKSYIIS